MSKSRWSKWSAGSGEKKLGFGNFFTEAQEQYGVNPTNPASGETPAQKAKRLNLVSDGHGAYSDPNTGEVVAKTVNGELVFYDGGPGGGAASDGEGGGDGRQTTQAPLPTYTDPDTGLVVPPPAQPQTPAARAEAPAPTPATAPGNFKDFVKKKKEKETRKSDLAARMSAAFDKNIGEEEPDDSVSGERNRVDNARMGGVETGDAHEQEYGEVDMGDAESMAGLAQSFGRTQKDGGAAQIELDISTDARSMLAQEKEDEDYEELVSAYEKEYEEALNTLRSLSDRKAKALEKQYAKFRAALSDIPGTATRASFLKSMAHAKTFEGRVNAGAGKNNLGYVDTQALVANRERLIEGYGDGSPETIKKFVDSVRSNKVSDSFVNASFEMLPEKFKKSLAGKGKVSGDKYKSDDKAHKDIHFQGWNADGTAQRGAADSKDRAKLMWRIYLEQGGRDAYTGLPLDLQAMDLEHVRGFNNKDGGNPGKTEWEQRENDNNFTLINSNVNQKKTDLSMTDFFEREVDPNADKTEDEFGGVEKLFDKQNEIQDVATQLSKTLLGDDGKGLGAGVTGDILTGHFQQDDQRYTDLREEFRKVGGKSPGGAVSKMGKTILKATGLTRGITSPDGRRTTSLPENMYRGFLISMASAPAGERQKYMDGWQEAIRYANDPERRNQKDVARYLKDNDLIMPEILQDVKGRGALGKVFMEEYYGIDGTYLEEQTFGDFFENYGDEKYSPKKLSKELPKGYKYGEERQGKGDHKTVNLEVDGKSTDMSIGGASGGKKSYSPSWGDGHRKVKKTLDRLDKTIDSIRKNSGKTSDTAKRMEKAAKKRAQTQGNKIISDITGKGRKTNEQGKGNKAQRRIDGQS